MIASFDKAIPPGQEGKITLKIRTDNMIDTSGKFRRVSQVHSNDPLKPKIELSMSFSIKQYISVKPHNKVMLFGNEGDKLSKKVTITSFEEQPLKIKDITSDVEDKIKYKLKTVKKGKEYTLEVKNRSTEKGRFQGQIELKTNSQKKPLVVIKVYGRIEKQKQKKKR